MRGGWGGQVVGGGVSGGKPKAGYISIGLFGVSMSPRSTSHRPRQA